MTDMIVTFNGQVVAAAGMPVVAIRHPGARLVFVDVVQAVTQEHAVSLAAHALTAIGLGDTELRSVDTLESGTVHLEYVLEDHHAWETG